MADEQKSELKPKKSILKQSTSFDKASQRERKMTWDEMNILATFHPEGKEYGHNKIDEPPTPYNYMSDLEGEQTESQEMCSCAFDPVDLASKLACRGNIAAETEADKEDNEESDDEEEMNETEEEKVRRLSFEEKRKLHYNEFYAMKLAKELMDQDDDDDDDDNDKDAGAGAGVAK